MASFDLNNLKRIGAGSSGIVCMIDEGTVIKAHFSLEDRIRDQEIEGRIFERLGNHPRIVRYLGTRPQGILLEKLKVCLRQRLRDLRERGALPLEDEIIKWSAQTAEGLQYVHSQGVLQGDIGCHNLLLDTDDNIKLCDFAGSSIDGEPSWVCYPERSQCPDEEGKDADDDEPTLKEELFAIGSTFYEISTTSEPYQDEENVEAIQQRYRMKIFPDVEHLLMGEIIQKCWNELYASTEEVVADIEQLQVSRGNRG